VTTGSIVESSEKIKPNVGLPIDIKANDGVTHHAASSCLYSEAF